MLGTTTITGGALTIDLANHDLSYPLVADAVRIQRIEGGGGQDDSFRLQAGSPALDAGNPSSQFFNEPAPNGGRINVGAYGNTPEALTSDPQFIQILSPNGLEKIEVGEPTTIEWRTSGLVERQLVAQYNSGTTDVDAWIANPYLIEGSRTSTTAAIDTSQVLAPAPEAVYQSYDYASNGVGNGLTYEIPVPDGSYELTLHFAELTYNSAGARFFDIFAQDVLLEDNYDIRATTGTYRTATTLTYQVTVSGGNGLELELVNQSNVGAILSGLEIKDFVPTGGTNLTGTLELSTDNGNNWQAVATGLPLTDFDRDRYLWTPSIEADQADSSGRRAWPLPGRYLRQRLPDRPGRKQLLRKRSRRYRLLRQRIHHRRGRQYEQR